MNLERSSIPRQNFLERYSNFITKHLSPIFDRTNKMIQKQAFIMAFMNMFAHTTKIHIITLPPEAEPRGIL